MNRYMSTFSSKVLVAGELERVPPELRPRFDPAQPLPADVFFFEEKTAGSVSRKPA